MKDAFGVERSEISKVAKPPKPAFGGAFRNKKESILGTSAYRHVRDAWGLSRPRAVADVVLSEAGEKATRARWAGKRWAEGQTTSTRKGGKNPYTVIETSGGKIFKPSKAVYTPGSRGIGEGGGLTTGAKVAGGAAGAGAAGGAGYAVNRKRNK